MDDYFDAHGQSSGNAGPGSEFWNWVSNSGELLYGIGSETSLRDSVESS